MGLPSLPLTWWAEEIGGSTDLSDYQIAHMPPAAACAGAARWAAKYKKYALLRSVFCRTACQHAAAKPINQRAAARCVGAAAGMGLQAIRCGTFLYRGWNRTREIQKPLVFGGVLFHISFAVERNMAAGGIEKKVVGPLRPKVTRARERGIFPPEGAIRAPPVADTAR